MGRFDYETIMFQMITSKRTTKTTAPAGRPLVLAR